MVFSSPIFLFYFLPLVCVVYFLTPERAKNAVLLLASLFFYAWGAGPFALVLLGSIAVNYCLGLAIGGSLGSERDGLRRLAVAGTVVVNLSLLGYYKYANFFVGEFAGPEMLQGWVEIALPIGISFFTFQSMSYAFDVARGRAEVLRNPIDYALYIALFPQLIAGPIVRYREIASQLRQRPQRLDDFASGALRFGHGLAKKVIVADSVGAIADAAFSLPGDELTTGAAWLGAFAYSIQIYFDFSGYSDMAIGLGRIFGFRLPENFRRPYSAVSITDFWRRWHITLSNWFRDYLYLPLGGSRGGSARTYFNLAAVFALVGIWHGANWTFLVWGGYHGALLIAERVTHQRSLEDVSLPALRRGVVFLLVTLGWVIFRAEDLSQLAAWTQALFRFDGLSLPLLVRAAINHQNAVLLAFGLAVCLLPRNFVAGVAISQGRGAPVLLGRALLAGVVLPFALASALSETFRPFLYFQF